MISLFLLCAGAFFGYWWLYRWAPARRTLDPAWCASHSRQEYWREVQKGIHRGEWNHDDGFAVGEYGDKSWAEWIMAHVEPGTDMSCMGYPCHSATSMRQITNQDVGYETDAWLEWWKNNKSKSQLDWIEDGFRLRGHDIDVPPLPAQIPTLLSILGKPTSEETSAVPGEIEYNAFRCLRDSGFEPVAYLVSNREPSPEVERGLLAYAKMERRWPRADRLGILPFENSDTNIADSFLPIILKPNFQFMANVLVFGSLLFGVGLLIHSYRTASRPSAPYVVFAVAVAGALTTVAVVALSRLFSR